ncbi:MAG: MFS transporter [Thermoplasmata archaeon]
MNNSFFNRLNKQIWPLAIARFIRAMGRVSAGLFMPIILLSIYHFSFLDIGIISGAVVLLMAIIQYYSGKWTDRIGRKAFFIWVPIPVALMYFVMFYTVFVRGNVLFLITGWLFTISLNSTQYPAIQAAIADVTDFEDRFSGYTLVRVMVNAGAAIGPLIGGFLSIFSLSYIFLVAAIATIAELFILYYMVEETYIPDKNINKKTKKRYGIGFADFDNRFLLLFSGIGIVFSFFLRQRGPTFTLFTFYFKNLPILDIGYIFALNGILVVLFQYPLYYIMDRKSTMLHWRAMGALVYAISYLVIPFAFSLYDFLFVMTIMTLGEDFVAPTTQTIITTIAPSNKRGTYIGIYNLITSFGSFAGTIIGLYFVSAYPFYFWFAVAFGMLIIATLYIMISNLYIKEREKAKLRKS